MGGKRAWVRKYVHFCPALLILLSISSCALLQDRGVTITQPQPPDAARQYLLRAQDLLAQRDYAGSLRESERAFSASLALESPGDEALFNIGMIHADPLNPKRDYAKSRASLQRLMETYLGSPWAERARNFTEMIKENEKLKKAAVEANRENEKLKKAAVEASQENENLKRAAVEANRENEKLKKAAVEASQESQKLKRIVEESRQVDIEIDEKKRSQAK